MSSGKGFQTQVAASIPFDNTGLDLDANNLQELGAELAAFGGGFNYGEDEAEATTSSTTYINKATLNVNLTVGSEYLLSWSTEVRTANGNSKKMEILIELDGADVVDEVLIQDTKGEWDVRSGFRKVTLTAGSHDLNVDFRSVSGTASLRRTRLSIWRVKDA